MTASGSALVVYASTHGQTGKIARRIGEVLTREGLDAHVFELPRHGPAPDPSDFDAVVVGGSIHAGRHHEHLLEWLRHHHVALGMRPSALFSVSLAAADDTDEARAATRELIDELVEDTDWTPDVALAVAGALEYREYDLPRACSCGSSHATTAPPPTCRTTASTPTGTPSSASRSASRRASAPAPAVRRAKRRLADVPRQVVSG